MQEGKAIVITGVSRGLGLSIARAVVQRGWTVYGISRQAGPDFTRLCAEFPTRAFFHAMDLSLPGDLREALWAGPFDRSTPLHGLVNNAGMAYDDLATNVQQEPLEAMMRLNLFAPMFLTREIIRNMINHRVAGSLVHISSVSAHTGYKGLAMYAASKGGLEAFSRTIAREWGGKGIRSNCVVPGFMETGMNRDLTPEQRAKIYRRTALGQPVDPASVTATVLHLLSDDAASLTGQNIIVDAGAL